MGKGQLNKEEPGPASDHSSTGDRQGSQAPTYCWHHWGYCIHDSKTEWGPKRSALNLRSGFGLHGSMPQSQEHRYTISTAAPQGLALSLSPPNLVLSSEEMLSKKDLDLS